MSAQTYPPFWFSHIYSFFLFFLSQMHGSSYQRKLAIVKGGATPSLDKPKRRTPAFSGRNAGQDKSQQRTRSMSHSPERHRIRGRSPAFTAIASAFENPSTRYLSTPPPAVKKLFPRSGGSELPKTSSKQSAINALTSAFEGPTKSTIPKSVKGTLSPIMLEYGRQVFSCLIIFLYEFLQN
jgi:gelsolin